MEFYVVNTGKGSANKHYTNSVFDYLQDLKSCQISVHSVNAFGRHLRQKAKNLFVMNGQKLNKIRVN